MSAHPTGTLAYHVTLDKVSVRSENALFLINEASCADVAGPIDRHATDLSR